MARREMFQDMLGVPWGSLESAWFSGTFGLISSASMLSF